MEHPMKLLICMLILFSSFAQASVERLLAMKLVNQFEELHQRSYLEGCSEENRERTCQALGEFKGALDVARELFRPSPDAGLEALQSFPFVLSSHLQVISSHVQRTLSSCGNQQGLTASLLTTQLNHYGPYVGQELEMLRSAVEGKRCTNI
jgi:hypothetical protein